jgi:ADP-heptose:LPS heptosyltransferase
MKKVLVANIFGIGDVLFTTPLISNLKNSIQGVTVDYLCNARTKDVVGMNPDVDDVFVYEKDEFLGLWKSSKVEWFKSARDLFSGIRKKRYDIVFDFTLSREFGLFFALSGIPCRIGLDYKKRGIFLTRKVPLTGFEDRHVVEYYLDLLDGLDVPKEKKDMRLVPEESSVEWASGYLKDKGAGGESVAAVIPGGGASWGTHAARKRWTPEGFAKVSDILIRHGVKVAIFGDPSETELCREVSRQMSESPVAVDNSLTLKQYNALLSRVDLALCNDGGPLHMAVALGVKTVSIFGPVDEKVYGPYPVSDKHKVITALEMPCRPCYGRFKLPECDNDIRCLADIEPERVANVCLELLGKPRSSELKAPSSEK